MDDLEFGIFDFLLQIVSTAALLQWCSMGQKPNDRPTVRLSLLFLCHLVMGLRIDANPYFAQRTKAKLGAPSSVFRNAPLESYPANPKQCHTYVEHSKIEVLSKKPAK